MDMEKSPIIRRRENNGSVEQTRIENGEKSVIPKKPEEEPDTEKELQDIEQKLRREMKGFLAQKNGIKEDE